MSQWRTLAQLQADLAEADGRARHHAQLGRKDLARRWRGIARVTRRLIARRQAQPIQKGGQAQA